MVKGQSRPRTPFPTRQGGGESRSGMNPGVGGSNPLVDTIFSIKINALWAFSPILLHYSSGFATNPHLCSLLPPHKRGLLRYRSISKRRTQYVSKIESYFFENGRIPSKALLTLFINYAINIFTRIRGSAKYSLPFTRAEINYILKTNQFTDVLSKEVFFIHIGRSW